MAHTHTLAPRRHKLTVDVFQTASTVSGACKGWNMQELMRKPTEHF